MVLLELIEPMIRVNLDLIKVEEEENTYYKLVERDINSTNYFKILIDGRKVYTSNFNSAAYVCQFKPGSEKQTGEGVNQLSLNEVGEKFQNWMRIIRTIDEIQSVHDDPFEKSYKDFFYAKVKLVDKDADIAPFNPDQQDQIEVFLSSITRRIGSSKDFSPEEVKTFIGIIDEIKREMPVSTKNAVLKRISELFAKLKKSGKALAKEMAKEAGKKLVGRIIEYGIENAHKIIGLLPPHN